MDALRLMREDSVSVDFIPFHYKTAMAASRSRVGKFRVETETDRVLVSFKDIIFHGWPET